MSRNTSYWLLAILVLSVLVRLVHIHAPLAGWHDWRQADTAAIARNFYGSGHSPLFPQIDWRGDTAGYVESEFPFYTYLVSLLYRLTGVHEVVGRAISILFSLVGIVGIFALARGLWSERAGLHAAAVMAFMPLHVIVGRAFMPESTMLAASIWGVFFFWRWCAGNRWRDYFASATCICLAVLIKPPALYLGLPLMVILVITRSWRALVTPWIWIWVMLILAPVAAWYYHAFGLWRETQLSFGVWSVGTDKWGNLDLLQSKVYYERVFGFYLFRRTLMPLGVALVILGLLVPRTGRHELLVDAWLVAILVYFLIVARGCYEHDYYQLPLLAPAALLVARVLIRLEQRLVIWGGRNHQLLLFMVLVTVYGLWGESSYLQTKILYERDHESTDLLEMSRVVKESTEPDALVIALNQNNPLSLYHAHRKGWNLNSVNLDVRFFEKRRPLGAAYFFGEKRHLQDREQQALHGLLADRYQVLVDTAAYFLWKLAANPNWREVEYVSGWKAPEAWGRWGVATELRIRAETKGKPATLVITTAAWQGAGDPPQVTVWHDADEIGEFTVVGRPWQWRSYALDLPVMDGLAAVDLTLICDRLRPANPGGEPLLALPVLDIATVTHE